jgi:hypothetical protein
MFRRVLLFENGSLFRKVAHLDAHVGGGVVGSGGIGVSGSSIFGGF